MGFWHELRAELALNPSKTARLFLLSYRLGQSYYQDRNLAYLPSLLELEDSVSKLLTEPDGEHRQIVNEYLEGLNRRSRSRAIYVMDTTGRVLATSDWRDVDSYLGEDLSFRAYFQNAVRGQPGRFYGIGSTTGEAGYYLAHGLRLHDKIIGGAVVKVRVLEVDLARKRIALTMRLDEQPGDSNARRGGGNDRPQGNRPAAKAAKPRGREAQPAGNSAMMDALAAAMGKKR